MGNAHSYPDSRPNTTVLYLQDPAQCCLREDFSALRALPEVVRAKNGCTPQEWEALMYRVETEANFVFGSKSVFGFAIIGGIFALIFIITIVAGIEGLAVVPFMLLAPCVVGYLFFIVMRNQSADSRVQQFIVPMQQQLGRVGIQFAYETMHTGICKPKHARVWRAFTLTDAVQVVFLQPAVQLQQAQMYAPQPVQAYGQQAVPMAQPYGQQAVPMAQPYGQQAVPMAQPYGQQAVPMAQPYGQQAMPMAQPYGQQAVPTAQPYDQQAMPMAQPRPIM
ncbi:hypothetical protein CYMTET_44225 [Cymbomonas tetramitiformis]|uniref:Uncharacterized protein n=1 Tax=Cymbomonas tetramitiformis TaxID=36881 RepID=A0AAE0C2B9_9CHLO|nr:hypothetical protein CYMTET_44225 [Cymbomonas tetramitiformis]